MQTHLQDRTQMETKKANQNKKNTKYFKLEYKEHYIDNIEMFVVMWNV